MIQEQLKEELKDALRAKDEVRLTTVRAMLAAFTNELVATKRKPSEALPDEDAIGVIRRLAKQRRESIEQFRAAKREDLAEREEAELAILETYLPKMMPLDDIRKVAQEKKEELSITEKTKMGVLMGAVMRELKGKADGADVKAVIDDMF